jgi:acetyl/propionyl-CoA carboxylase alpha subunit
VQQSYTNIGRIIDVALEAGCDAVHPGYGFLSERADFAAAVVASGLTWIGPTAASISSLGSKTAARAVAISNGVPVATGTSGELTDEQLVAEANRPAHPAVVGAGCAGRSQNQSCANNFRELGVKRRRTLEATMYF